MQLNEVKIHMSLVQLKSQRIEPGINTGEKSGIAILRQMELPCFISAKAAQNQSL